MRQALLIFRKDVDYLRWPLSAFLLLLAVRMTIDILLPRHPDLVMMQGILEIVFVMAAIGLIYSAVQQERTVGERQYWLTRPFSWRSMLAAKALFVLFCLLAPVFVSAAVALAVNGVSPWPTGPLVLVLAFATAFLAAIASVTRNTVQFVLTLVTYVVLAVLSSALMGQLISPEAGNWGDAQSPRVFGELLVLLTAIATVLWLQYGRRATGRSRVVLGAAMLVNVVGLPGWHAAFALLERMEGPGPSGAVSIRFDVERPARSAPGSWTNPTNGDAVGIRIPVAIAGIPSNAALVGERVRTIIDAGNGRRWDSGWRASGGIIGKGDFRYFPNGITEGSDHWLEVNVDASFYDDAKLADLPVRVQSTLALMIPSNPRRVRLPVPSTAYRAGPLEFCSVSSPGSIGGPVGITCLSAWGAGQTDDVVRITDGRRTEAIAAGVVTLPLSAWNFASYGASSLNLAPTAVLIESRTPAGFFERTMTVDSIHLAPYFAGRSGPRRVAW